MKKNRGQVLVETLVTSVLVVIVLLYLFVQLRTIVSSYSVSSHYNTADALYAAETFRGFLLKDNYRGDGTTNGILGFYRSVNMSGSETKVPYFNLETCPLDASKLSSLSSLGDFSENETSLVNGVSFCQTLVQELKIKKVIFTTENAAQLHADIDALRDSVTENDENASNRLEAMGIDRGFQDFIKYQAVTQGGEEGVYRLYLETTEGNYASIKVK